MRSKAQHRGQQNSIGAAPINPEAATRPKKPYQSPRVVVYGDLHRLTTGGTKSHNEQNVSTGASTRPG